MFISPLQGSAKSPPRASGLHSNPGPTLRPGGALTTQSCHNFKSMYDIQYNSLRKTVRSKLETWEVEACPLRLTGKWFESSSAHVDPQPCASEHLKIYKI